MAKQENDRLAMKSHTPRAVNFALTYSSDAESEIWVTRARLSKNPKQLTLQIDGVNAFNELHREPMLQACNERVPSFHSYTHGFYGAHQADVITCMD